MKNLNFLLIGLVSVTLFSACSGDKELPPLEGERISLFELEREIAGVEEGALKRAPDTTADLTKVWRNEFWPQAGGYANHAMQHVSLNKNLKRVWSSSIGSGASKDLPLTSQPIIADGRVFTLDAKARVRAFDAASGRSIWSAKAIPEGEDDPVIGGGIAYSGGRLFVAAGFNEVIALSPADGSVLWRAKTGGAVRGAPSAMPGSVYALTVDNETVAMNADDGTIEWTHQGLTETTGLLGAASPAANRDIVLPAYSSGEIYALNAENGATLWSDTVAPMARPGLGAVFSDIRGLPVIDRGIVIAISYGGRIAATDERTGERKWDAKIAGSQTPWVSGNRVFIVSSDAEAISLDLANGRIVWRNQLQKYRDPDDLEGPLVWYGPILAGGRLALFSSNGSAVDIDPVTGDIIGEWSTGQNVAAAPAVAGETLYLLSRGGTLTAWR